MSLIKVEEKLNELTRADFEGKSDDSLRAIMLADIGGHRQESVPMHNGRRDGRGDNDSSQYHRPRHHEAAVVDRDRINKWKRADFKDDDHKTVEGLDTMANGQLHRHNAGKLPSMNTGGPTAGPRMPVFGPRAGNVLQNHQDSNSNSQYAPRPGRNPSSSYDYAPHRREFAPHEIRDPRPPRQPGAGHQGSGPIPGIRPQQRHPTAENVKAEKEKKAAEKPSQAEVVVMKAPANIIASADVHISIHKIEKYGDGKVFLVGTNVPFNSRFIAFLGTDQVANIHPCEQTDYASGNARTITLIFATGLKIKLVFGTAPELSKFWDLFRELKKVGKGGDESKAAELIATEPEPLPEPTETPEAPSTVPATVSEAEVVVPAPIATVQADLLTGDEAIDSAPQASSAHPSVDLLSNDLAGLKLSDGSSPSETREATELPASSTLINLNHDVHVEQKKTRRVISSSYDDELSSIQPSPIVEQPAAIEVNINGLEQPTATEVDTNDLEQPAAAEDDTTDILPEDDSFLTHLGDSVTGLFKVLNGKMGAAKAKALINKYLVEAGIGAGEELTQKSCEKLSTTVTQVKQELEEESAMAATIEVTAPEVVIKSEPTPEAEGGPSYTAQELMALRAPQEISDEAERVIRNLRLSPQIGAVNSGNKSKDTTGATSSPANVVKTSTEKIEKAATEASIATPVVIAEQPAEVTTSENAPSPSIGSPDLKKKPRALLIKTPDGLVVEPPKEVANQNTSAALAPQTAPQQPARQPTAPQQTAPQQTATQQTATQQTATQQTATQQTAPQQPTQQPTQQNAAPAPKKGLSASRWAK